MTLMNYISMWIGYAVLGLSMAWASSFALWFFFILIAEWFIKKYQDWDIFCDAVVMAHKKRGIDAYRSDK